MARSRRHRAIAAIAGCGLALSIGFTVGMILHGSADTTEAVVLAVQPRAQDLPSVSVTGTVERIGRDELTIRTADTTVIVTVGRATAWRVTAVDGSATTELTGVAGADGAAQAAISIGMGVDVEGHRTKDGQLAAVRVAPALPVDRATDPSS